MAEEHHQHSGEKVVGEEVTDRGLFDFLGKKKEHEHDHEGEGKCEEVTVTEVEKAEGEALATEFDKVQVTEPAVKEEEKKEGLMEMMEKLRRSHGSSSSSSSDEEDAAEGEKKKKKKSLKDKIKEKISGEKKEEAAEEHKMEADPAAAVVVEDNTIPVEKIDELAPPEYSDAQEKKSLLDKIKEKLPGGKKPAEEAAAAAPVAAAAEQGADHQLGKEHGNEGDSPKEKKGFLGKIMDKIPGYHKGTGPEDSSAVAH